VLDRPGRPRSQLASPFRILFDSNAKPAWRLFFGPDYAPRLHDEEENRNRLSVLLPADVLTMCSQVGRSSQVPGTTPLVAGWFGNAITSGRASAIGTRIHRSSRRIGSSPSRVVRAVSCATSRLRRHASAGVETMESIMTRSGLAQNTQAQQRECEVLQRHELGEFSLSLDDSAPELCGVNRSK